MNKRQRNTLRELMDRCNELGGALDGTSTTESKYRDRQESLMQAYWVLLAVLSDHPDNDNTEWEYQLAKDALNKMKELKSKKYPDKNGNY